MFTPNYGNECPHLHVPNANDVVIRGKSSWRAAILETNWAPAESFLQIDSSEHLQIFLRKDLP
jgi:hypothetical protein